MANFVFLVFLFAALHSGTRACEYRQALDAFDSCIRQWNYGGKYRSDPAAFMRDITVTDEICREGSIDSMQDCMSTKVPVDCNSAHRYWRSVKGKFRSICRHYPEFKDEHRHCRVNERVLQKLTSCTYDNFRRIESGQNFCLSSRDFFGCTKRAFGKHCTDKAAKFFLKVFYTEMSPEIEHQGCATDDIVAEIYSNDPLNSETNRNPQPLDVDSSKRRRDAVVIERYNAMESGVSSGKDHSAISLCLTLYSVLHLFVSWF